MRFENHYLGYCDIITSGKHHNYGCELFPPVTCPPVNREVRVPQEDLNRFVIIANKFQLGGLLTDELDLKEGDPGDEEKDDYEQFVQYRSEVYSLQKM